MNSLKKTIIFVSKKKLSSKRNLRSSLSAFKISLVCASGVSI